MATYKKEYSYLVEDIVTECDIYSADGHKFHTERAFQFRTPSEGGLEL